MEAFSCGNDPDDEDLNAFLRDDAGRLEDLHVIRTCCSLYEGRLVGYVSILTDSLMVKTGEKRKLKLDSSDNPIMPAIKVARLAVDAKFRERFYGIGRTLMLWAFGEALEVGVSRVGCRLLTVDARPKAVGFYTALEFVPNKASRFAKFEGTCEECGQATPPKTEAEGKPLPAEVPAPGSAEPRPATLEAAKLEVAANGTVSMRFDMFAPELPAWTSGDLEESPRA